MKNKINIRLVGIAILAVIGTVIGVTIIFYNLFQKQVQKDLKMSAKLLKDSYLFDKTRGEISDIDSNLKLEDLRITWVDTDGRVLYDNDVSPENLSNHNDRPEIKEAFSKGEGEIVRKSDTMNNNTFYYAIRLDNGTVVRVATNARSLWAVILSVVPLLMLIIILIIVICIFLSHMLTRQLITPITKMLENIENADYESPYKELDPLATLLRRQHMDVLSAAKARQDFTANVSHELKTPLTAITGYVELLEGDMVFEDQKQHIYHEIKNNSNRLLALINDIIRLSELDRNTHEETFESLDLYETLKDCMGNLKVNAKQKNINLDFRGIHCEIRGNVYMIRELVENLVQNAIRYNNPGGNVTVLVELINGRPSIIVRDNGIGILASEQERIFERFYRVDKSRSKATGGTGLGLAIVKHIVELHDAKIMVDSAPNVGTTMTVIF